MDRVCSQCGNKVNDDKLVRCPRCNQPLFKGITCDGACSKCGNKDKGKGCC